MGIGALGAAAIGMFTTSSTVLGVSVAAGSIAAGVVGGAIVGAVVGGLMAAVTGGSIASGMLFGAIGGAVTGGLTAGFGAAGGITTPSGELVQTVGGTANAQLQAAESAMLSGTEAAGGGVTQVGAGNLVGSGIGAGLEKLGTQVGTALISEGAKAYMGSIATADQNEYDMAAAEAAHERNLETIRLQGDISKELKGMDSGSSGGSSSDSAAAQLSYDARMAELDQRKVEFGETMGLQQAEFDAVRNNEANRGALFSGSVRRSTDVGTADDVQTTGIGDQLQGKNVEAVGETFVGVTPPGTTTTTDDTTTTDTRENTTTTNASTALQTIEDL